MSCENTTNNFCFSSFVDLCSALVQQCVSKQTINDLISNQSRLADAIAPVVSGVDGVVPACGRVYLDTSSGTYTGTSGANTVPVGIHAFGGRVVFDGNVSCATVGLDGNGDLATAGAYLDGDLNVTGCECDACFVLLEDATAEGCNLIMPFSCGTVPTARVTASAVVPIGTVVQYDNVTVVNNNGFTINTATGEICVPCDGEYQIKHDAFTSGATGAYSLEIYLDGVPADSITHQNPNAGGYGAEAGRIVFATAGQCFTGGVNHSGEGGIEPTLTVNGAELFIEKVC